MDGERSAWGYGLETVTAGGSEQLDVVLDTWYPTPALGQGPGDDPYGEPADLAAQAKEYPRRWVRTQVVYTAIDLDRPPADAPDAYLRLHLLSHRLVAPNTVNLDGIYGVLANVVWTSLGPCVVPDFEARRLQMRDVAPVQVFGVDKFPRMTDYVVPSGVRIFDASSVRLGAHLAPGTTVMPAGFVNFNAGTLGGAMVEGRISQGVVVEEGCDIGGGASIMGTMSGGGAHRVRVGKRCLVGAQAGLGISLGDDCVVEAGLYLTAGTKVSVSGEAAGGGEAVGDPPGEAGAAAAGDPSGGSPRVVKAAELSGRSRLLYWRNSLTGSVEARPRAGSGSTLNTALHAH